MELILWRHAEAEDERRGIADMKRRLTTKGEKQARLVGRWLKGRLPKKTRIIVSPAMRAQQTVLSLEMAYDTEARIGPEANAGDLLATAGWPNLPMATLIVGHQPALGALASLLLCGEEGDFSMRKGSVWWITNRRKEQDEKTYLRAVISPELL